MWADGFFSLHCRSNAVDFSIQILRDADFDIGPNAKKNYLTIIIGKKCIKVFPYTEWRR